MGRIVILKIGGSVITEKDKPLTSRSEGIQSAAEGIAEFGEPLVLVHGAGSFGHFLARKHGLSRHPSLASPAAVSEIRGSVMELNSMVIGALRAKGIQVYWLQPFALYNTEGIHERWKAILTKLIRQGISPISFGDVIPTSEGFRIISGDEIVRDLAELLQPARVVFATDVDGIYRSYRHDKHPIEELSMEEAKLLAVDPVKIDVTGGMKGKLKEAIKIAGMGINVHFTNGLKEEHLIKALKGKDHKGTLLKGKVLAYPTHGTG